MRKKRLEIVESEWLINKNYKGRVYFNRKSMKRRGAISRRGRHWRTLKTTRSMKMSTTKTIVKTEKLVKKVGGKK